MERTGELKLSRSNWIARKIARQTTFRRVNLIEPPLIRFIGRNAGGGNRKKFGYPESNLPKSNHRSTAR
jgi:hypothetical protein